MFYRSALPTLPNWPIFLHFNSTMTSHEFISLFFFFFLVICQPGNLVTRPFRKRTRRGEKENLIHFLWCMFSLKKLHRQPAKHVRMAFNFTSMVLLISKRRDDCRLECTVITLIGSKLSLFGFRCPIYALKLKQDKFCVCGATE